MSSSFPDNGLQSAAPVGFEEGGGGQGGAALLSGRRWSGLPGLPLAGGQTI